MAAAKTFWAELAANMRGLLGGSWIAWGYATRLGLAGMMAKAKRIAETLTEKAAAKRFCEALAANIVSLLGVFGE